MLLRALLQIGRRVSGNTNGFFFIYLTSSGFDSKVKINIFPFSFARNVFGLRMNKTTVTRNDTPNVSWFTPIEFFALNPIYISDVAKNKKIKKYMACCNITELHKYWSIKS